MNLKIIIGIGILIVLAFGFVLNFHYEHPEDKQNLTTNNTENTGALNNHSVIKIEENKTINEVNKSNRQHILLEENKTINKTAESNISQEKFLKNLSNTSCKEHILKNYFLSAECKGDEEGKLVCTRDEHIEEIPIYTKIKGIEEINGKKYVVVESKPFIDKDAFLFNKDNLTSSLSLHIFETLSKTCPPQCEEIIGKSNSTIFLNPEYTLSKEYVDVETGKIKIIAIPIVKRYKLENNTLYKRKEIFQDGKIEYDYNFTDYAKYPSEFKEFFKSLQGVHPLYVPGFIKNFKMENIAASRNVKDMHTECSEDIKTYMEGHNGEKIGLYNCIKHITINYIRKADGKTIMNKTYIENVSFNSPTRENPIGGIMSVKQQNIAESLLWEGKEKVNGKEAYKIVYIYKSDFAEERYTVWINDKGMLIGIKEEMRYTNKNPSTLNNDWMILHTYMLVNESDSCDV